MKTILVSLFILFGSSAFAQNNVGEKDTIPDWELDEVVVVKRIPGNLKLSGAENSFQINRQELFRAACCNLGERPIQKSDSTYGHLSPFYGSAIGLLKWG